MNFDLKTFFAWFVVFEWLLRVWMLFRVPRRRKPSSANAWLLLIMITPSLGTLLFYLFGDPKLPKLRQARRRAMDGLTKKELTLLGNSHKKLFAHLDDDAHGTHAKLATLLGGMPPMTGNEVTCIASYNDVFSKMIADIAKAREYIHIEYFIIAYDDVTKPVFVALEEAVQRGVKVRLLYDRLVSRHYPKFRKLRAELDRIGVEHHPMLPLNLLPGKNFTRPDLRNHRKIVVIDGETAYSGSQNLIDKSYHRSDDIKYEELVLRMRGPIVWQYNNIFRTDWHAETQESLSDLVEDEDMPENIGDVIGQVLPSGPAHEHDNNLKFYTSMVHAAKERVGIVVPYFIPDESFLDALTAAAQRGVQVTMINSEAIDKLLAGHAQRSYYEELLEAGVEIYLYKKPTFLHTKQVLIDGDVAIIGSSNLDIRSFELDLEVTTILYDRKIVSKLESIEGDYRSRSVRVSMKKWQTRSRKDKMLDSVARLTAALQ